jgi:hypothetical protein
MKQPGGSTLADSAPATPARAIPFGIRALDVWRAVLTAGVVAFSLAALLAVATAPTESSAQAVEKTVMPVKVRHIGVLRDRATKQPRCEGDQALVDGWPLYRTESAQAAFNNAMATLRATDGAAPSPRAFKGCAGLECNLSLPRLGPDGWVPSGRIWVSPTEYVLVVHSPRLRDRQTYRRRANGQMKYFVFHEFQNSSRNTDLYDTISSHKDSVFVPLYMSKPATDAKGRRFVIVLQVAPYDVLSIHATNWGSAGPGMEVAKNASDPVEPLQNLAGILVATIIKTAAPQLRVVNHHGAEGVPMLSAYEHRLATLRERPDAPIVVLPFVPALAPRVATATARLEELIARHGTSPGIPIAERGGVPRATEITAAAPKGLPPEPTLIGPIRLVSTGVQP